MYATPTNFTGISTIKLTGRLCKVFFGHPHANDETLCAQNSLQEHLS